jgi:hypothetical protein
MAIKFEKIQPGMTLFDIHSERMGNTTMRELGKWDVYIVSVDPTTRSAIVKWNGNPPKRWYERALTKLYATEPKRYREQQESKRSRGAY